MPINQEIKKDLDNLEYWLLSSFMKEMGRYFNHELIEDYDIHIRPPKDYGGIFSVLVTSKRRDDFLRILVYIDKFEQYTDDLSSFVLTQKQNYGSGNLDEVFVSFATISKSKYPHLYKYVSNKKFLDEIVNAEYFILMEDGTELLTEDAGDKIKLETKLVV